MKSRQPGLHRKISEKANNFFMTVRFLNGFHEDLGGLTGQDFCGFPGLGFGGFEDQDFGSVSLDIVIQRMQDPGSPAIENSLKIYCGQGRENS